MTRMSRHGLSIPIGIYMGDFILGVILQYMFSASVCCFLWLVKGYLSPFSASSCFVYPVHSCPVLPSPLHHRTRSLASTWTPSHRSQPTTLSMSPSAHSLRPLDPASVDTPHCPWTITVCRPGMANQTSLTDFWILSGTWRVGLVHLQPVQEALLTSW